MHQNAPLLDKKSRNFLGRGTAPSPTGEGIPLPRPHHPRRLDSRSFGALRSCSFLFTTRTLGIRLLTVNIEMFNTYTLLAASGVSKSLYRLSTSFSFFSSNNYNHLHICKQSINMPLLEKTSSYYCDCIPYFLTIISSAKCQPNCK